MAWLYNIGIGIYLRFIRLAARWYPKAKEWCDGREGLFGAVAAAVAPGERIVWVHAASLGEFEQGLPVVEAIRTEHPEYKILLTFFSPSGYGVRKNYAGVDYVFYLPADTPANARRFVELVRPEIALFIKYEFWFNMLAELRRHGVRTYLISSIFRRDSIFFRFYGSLWRRMLRCFDTIFVQDGESLRLLGSIGIDRVVVSGDTRFDRVARIAETAPRIELVERFRGGSRLFIAGSVWKEDEDILLPFINANPSIKFIIAPREMDEMRIARVCAGVRGGAVRYSRCTPSTSFDDVQVMVLDTVGLLASAYGYASWAYIGGGFGAGIHNTLEAAVFGVPTLFGPNHGKFKEACDMVKLGAAAAVCDGEDLMRRFVPLRDDAGRLAEAGRRAREYVLKNRGASAVIMQSIFGGAK